MSKSIVVKTGIEYLDGVINYTHGCTAISPGCDNCWAKKCAETRLRSTEKRPTDYPADDPFRVVECWDKLDGHIPGSGKRIGISFMGDFFHPDVSVLFIEAVFGMLAKYPDNDYYFLTKRAGQMEAVLGTLLRPVYRNWHFGVTAENQTFLDLRLPGLLEVGHNPWLSLEPLLGPIVIPPEALKRLQWVVVGAESGPGRRPCDVEWIVNLLYQCRSQRVEIPVFIKQADIDGTLVKLPLIDGRVWDQYPEVTR